MKKKLNGLKGSVTKTAATMSILLALVTMMSCNASAAVGGGEGGSSYEKDFTLKQLRSNSIQGYYTIRNNLMKQVVEQIDFTNINLEKSYSLKRLGQGPSVTYDEKDESKINCAIMWDTDEHVIFKSGRAIVITRDYNAKFIENVGCSESDLADSIRIESYLVPHKSEFKKTFLKAQWVYQDAIIKSGKGQAISEEAVFTIDNTGYTVMLQNGSSFGMHPGTAVNPSMVFSEDETDTTLLDSINFGELDMNSKIDRYSINDSVFVGGYSKNVIIANPALAREQSIDGKTIGEFIKEM